MPSLSVYPRHYIAIFLVALVTIACQILVTRIFSVTFHYHFSFAGITLAMLGLTAGALRVYEKPEIFSAVRANAVLSEYSTKCGINLFLAVVLHAWFPGVADQWRNGIAVVDALPVASLLFSFICLLYAFIQAGICIALLLTRFPQHTGKLYAADLCGAASGCIAVILALKFLNPISAVLVLSIALCVMAWRLLPTDASSALTRQVKVTTTLLALIAAVQTASTALHTPLLHLTWAKQSVIETQPLFERWNTYSRIAVTDYESRIPFGWGFGKEPTARVEQKYLNIDADAGTILTKFDGNLEKVHFLLDDIINIGYHIRPIDSVAVIGIGGGRDILSALAAGATRIQGIELNPAIVEALTNTFAEFTGNLHQQPAVSVDVAEARSFLTSNPDSYDLIQISLIDTWAATAAGGLTLSENKLYTTNAWNDFLDRLSDDGMLAVSRWYEPNIHQGEFYRMVAIASDVLKTRNPNADPRQHLLVAYAESLGKANGVITVVISKSPLSPQEIERFNHTMKERHFIPLLTPDFAVDDIADTIASGRADKAFFDGLTLDFSPSTDNRPFFFHMLRLENVFGGENAKETTLGNANYRNNSGVIVLFSTFFIILLCTIIFIGYPLVRLHRKHAIPLVQTLPFLLYFSGIGLGFMLIEISQMQRLMIFLGHPVYGLSVVLFTLLLSSSLGSYLLRNIKAPTPGMWVYPALLCLILMMTALFTPALTEQLKYYDIPVRIIVSGALLALMGIGMGMMFPLGVVFASVKHAHILPWYWGINGATSVLASVLAVVLSLHFGISFTFWAGIGCYVLCMLVVYSLAKRHRA